MRLYEKESQSSGNGGVIGATLISSKFDLDGSRNYFIKGEDHLTKLGDEGRISRAVEPFWSLSRLFIAVMSAELVADVIPYCIEEGFVEFRWKTRPRLYLQLWYNPEDEDEDASLTLNDITYYNGLFVTFTLLPESGAILNKEFPFSNHAEIESVLKYLKLSKNTAELVEKLFHSSSFGTPTPATPKILDTSNIGKSSNGGSNQPYQSPYSQNDIVRHKDDFYRVIKSAGEKAIHVAPLFPEEFKNRGANPVSAPSPSSVRLATAPELMEIRQKLQASGSEQYNEWEKRLYSKGQQ
jgi:hypothetical protein